ncbi:serine/threonine protein kinase [Magnetovirga frankeli]|uniref:serine/threonine protein kinase n=1 Tax=Magnetovirga frankeli TaxID=947516 RepID=UPI001292CDB0|nr:serine/threonine protein kinase [gamma proteobacterium SS-5]
MNSNPIDPTPYYRLDPDSLMQALESLGLVCDGRLLALNSYENRVYQVGLEGAEPLVVKFYRPGRWSDAQILEEHGFALELQEAEIPLIAPLSVQGQTLHQQQGFRFALFPRRGGRAPELDHTETQLWLGRTLGRLHALGASRAFQHRPAPEPLSAGQQALDSLQQGNWLPPHLEQAFTSLVADLLRHIRLLQDQIGTPAGLRIHGDLHPGNILWRDGPLLVDLDDCRTGPAIQDLWMLLSGDLADMGLQLRHILEGYEQFHGFNPIELNWIEPLRSLRMLQHAAWIAQRWQDPAFPLAFSWFDSSRYWEDLILGLREQLRRMQDSEFRLVYP